MPVQNMKLEEARARFLLSREADGAGASIRRQNEGTLRNLQNVIGNINVREFNAHHVDLFLIDRRKSRGEGGINNDKACLRLFIAWAHNARILAAANNPMFGKKRVTVAPKDRLRIPMDRFEDLLDATECERDRALIATGLGLMIRQGEMGLIQLHHVHLDENYILVDPYKGKKPPDRMPINPWYRPHLERWLTAYKVMFRRQELPPEFFLIPGRWGHQPYRNRVTGLFEKGTFGNIDPWRPAYEPHKVVQKAMDKIGFPHREPTKNGKLGKSTYEGEHTLRRSGARAAYEQATRAGVVNAIGKMQEMLHHSNPQQTRDYIGLFSFREERDEWLSSIPMYDTLRTEDELAARRRRAITQR